MDQEEIKELFFDIVAQIITDEIDLRMTEDNKVFADDADYIEFVSAYRLKERDPENAEEAKIAVSQIKVAVDRAEDVATSGILHRVLSAEQ